MNHYVFLHEGYADWELGYILPELHQLKKKIVTFGITKDPVTSLGSLKVTPEITIDDVKLDDAAALIIPGGTIWGTGFDDPKLRKLVQETHRSKNIVLAGICDATVYFGKIGLLDERAHTGNALEQLAEIPEYKGKSHYRDVPAYRDEKFITASGYGAIDFAVKIFEALGLSNPEALSQWAKANQTGKWE